MIHLSHVNMTYSSKSGEKIEALRDVSLSVQPAEFIMITGPSGSGKSTLLQILGCITRQTSGKYAVDGNDVDNLGDKELAQLRNKEFGFILQNFGLMSYRSVYDNVRLPLLFQKEIRGSAIKQKCVESLQRVGMAEHLARKAWELSGGEMQRVALARAIVNDPNTILADEPTGSLDGENKERVMKTLADIHQGGKTIIMVTHDLSLLSYATRHLQIKDGEIFE